ncbi:gamma-glutamyltransferase family protein [Chachezhania sediminis]|uniref:gamma-glutamyltransferase family protein n=1 Tax=Chachezhania sediminis TaxID=2599291 RepID=UPI00131E55F9|nr:gamma-glutamyltransferase family protein [Chachezhania sediminis]
MKDVRWDSRKTVARAPAIGRDAVATSHPLAAQAGLAMLRAGGNAVDAALAAGIALIVLEPVSTGLGGDAFAMVSEPGQDPVVLNGTGRAPLAWTEDRVAALDRIPPRGWGSVTTPGTVAAWVDLSERFGRLPFETLFEPAIDWAREGAPLAPGVRGRWQIQVDGLKDQPGFAEAYLPQGLVPQPGAIFRQPDLAASLELIASTRGRAFYEGPLADAMVAHAVEHGGLLRHEDLVQHRSEWGVALSSTPPGAPEAVMHVAPPNTQALVIELTLGILSHFDAPLQDPDSVEGRHLQIEAFKCASADVAAALGDPAGQRLPLNELRDPDHAARRAARVERRAAARKPGLPGRGGTVAVVAADREGRMVSFLQSNFVGFGSGVVVPGTGISFHNRMGGFSLRPGHPNLLVAGKRPLHTLMPSLLTVDGLGQAAVAVSGGNMQPQVQIALALRLLAAGGEPQTAIDGPRHRHVAGLDINLEAGIAPHVVAALAERGHKIVPPVPGYMDFGSAQMLWRLDDAWLAATDSRKDGAAVAW